MNNKGIFEYIKTIFATLIFIVAVTLLITLNVKQNAMESPLKNSFQKYKFEQINLLIEQYKYEEKKYPANYLINLELGLLYESIAKLKQAEKNYKKAIKKSPFKIFNPKFALADLYLKQKRFDEATILIDELEEYPEKNLIIAKARFYKKLANKLYQEGHYFESVQAYNKAYYYKGKTKIKFKNIKKDTIDAYLSYSNEYKYNKERAIEITEEGLKLIPNSPKLLYQLAILKTESDPELSLKLLSKIQRIKPTIINYNAYFNFLDTLKSESYDYGDHTQAMIYEEKIKKLQRFIDYNITYPDDFSIKVYKAEYFKKKLGIEHYIDIQYAIHNKSYEEVPKLYSYIEIYNNNKLTNTYKERIVKRGEILKPGQATKKINVKIKFDNKDDFIQSSDVTVAVYITKNPKVEKTLIGKFLISKK